MFSSSNRSPKCVSRVFVGVVLVLLNVAIFTGLEVAGVEAPATPVASAVTLSPADSGRVAGEPQILEVVSTLGHQAVRMLTTVITAVFDGWWQPIDVALDWVDGIRRGWTAVHRFPGTAAPRS